MNKKILAKIEELSRANVNVSYYDQLRHEEVKKQKAEVNKEQFYRAFKVTRRNNELRAVHKNELDRLFSIFVRDYEKGHQR